MRKISIISLFPEVVEAYFKVGMLAKAVAGGQLAYEVVDLRQYGLGARRQVDDLPYGGGAGMILRIEPLVAAIEAIKAQTTADCQVILLTPRGHLFDQGRAQALASQPTDLILVGGRYTGYDERLRQWVDLSLSIGNYVLTGSELPALVVADALVRLIPGVLGGDSRQQESHSQQLGQVGYPQYTRPAVFRQLAVPDVLLTGHHGQIEAWRQSQIKNFKL